MKERTHATVFLSRKKYDGVLKVVSAHTNARYFRVRINRRTNTGHWPYSRRAFSRSA